MLVTLSSSAVVEWGRMADFASLAAGKQWTLAKQELSELVLRFSPLQWKS
jgi:hypothetical protein